MNNSGLEENYIEKDIKKRLIIAGIKELEKNGLSNFSYRKVANACGVSCATPYRHFKSIDDFILSILDYINVQWDTLFLDLCEIFKNDLKTLIIESVSSTIRFFYANSNYRTVVFSDIKDKKLVESSQKKHLGKKLGELVFDYCEKNNIENKESRAFAVCSALYGSIIMTWDSDVNQLEHAITLLKQVINSAL